MIYANRKNLIIPFEERIIGHFGDNSVHTRLFEINDELSDNISCELYILFCDGKINSIILEKSENDDNIFTWNVSAEHIFTPGIAYIQLRAVSENGEVWHSPRSTVEFLSSIDKEYSEACSNYSPTFFEQIDEKINELSERIETSDFGITEEELAQILNIYITDDEITQTLENYITRSEAEQLVEESLNDLMLPLNLRLEGENTSS